MLAVIFPACLLPFAGLGQSSVAVSTHTAPLVQLTHTLCIYIYIYYLLYK